MTTDVINDQSEHDSHDGEHHDHKMTGLKRWLYTTNHKDIGSMYLWFSFIMFLTGGVMALVIRAELFQPGLQIVEPDFFNQMTTVHGLIMVFGAIMPAFTGLVHQTLAGPSTRHYQRPTVTVVQHFLFLLFISWVYRQLWGLLIL